MSKLWLRVFVLALATLISNAFRFAWRTDTKVFPYNVFPTPSTIDNGDNGGKILPEIVPE